MSFSIKLQEINLNVCEEYNTKREACDENMPAKRANFLNYIVEFKLKFFKYNFFNLQNILLKILET